MHLAMDKGEYFIIINPSFDQNQINHTCDLSSLESKLISFSYIVWKCKVQSIHLMISCLNTSIPNIYTAVKPYTAYTACFVLGCILPLSLQWRLLLVPGSSRSHMTLTKLWKNWVIFFVIQ